MKQPETNLKHFFTRNSHSHNNFPARISTNLKLPRMGRGPAHQATGFSWCKPPAAPSPTNKQTSSCKTNPPPPPKPPPPNPTNPRSLLSPSPSLPNRFPIAPAPTQTCTNSSALAPSVSKKNAPSSSAEPLNPPQTRACSQALVSPSFRRLRPTPCSASACATAKSPACPSSNATSSTNSSITTSPTARSSGP